MRHINCITWPVCLTALAAIACGEQENTIKPEPEPAPIPSITVQDSIVTVKAEGESVSINYEIGHHVQNGIMTASVSSDCDWISEPEILTLTDSTGNVQFSILANNGQSERSAAVSLTYTYNDSESVSATVPIVQECADYDYELAATVFTGTYFGDRNGLNGEFNYYTWLSDLPFDEYGFGQQGGRYYRFDIYSEKPEDSANPYPAAGLYTLGEKGSTALMTFAPEYSAYSVMGDGKVDTALFFTSGNLSITRSDDSFIIEAFLTDTDGKRHHVTYQGSIAYDDQSEEEEGPDIIHKDIDFTATDASAIYYRQIEDNMWATMQFSDEETVITLDICMPFDQDGGVAPGNYGINSSETAFSCYPGYIQELYGEFSIRGTYITLLNEDGSSSVACLTGGEMTVERNGETYSIQCDFISADNNTMRCSYSGELNVLNIPGNNSTLTSDYTLDFSNAQASASFIGDTFETYCDNWILTIGPVSGSGDTFITHVACRNNGFDGGIASGTYNAGSCYWPFEYLQGSINTDGYNGTWYFGGSYKDGDITAQAPAMSGPINITNNEDGTYSISFTLLDDKGNTWSGEWSGAISTSNDSGI